MYVFPQVSFPTGYLCSLKFYRRYIIEVEQKKMGGGVSKGLMLSYTQIREF